MLTGNTPTSRELIALTKCTFHVHCAFCVYHFEGSELNLTQRGLYLPYPYSHFDIEEIWVEIPGVSIACIHGKSKGTVVMEGAVHLASA